MERVKGASLSVVKSSLLIYKAPATLGWTLAWCASTRNELSSICGFEVEGLGAELRSCSNHAWVRRAQARGPVWEAVDDSECGWWRRARADLGHGSGRARGTASGGCNHMLVHARIEDFVRIAIRTENWE